METRHFSKDKEVQSHQIHQEGYDDHLLGQQRSDSHRLPMNGEYYAKLLKQVRQSIKVKRRGKIRRGILLHQDNAPVHTSRVAITAVHECGNELLPHPPYFPDLAPSHFHLFPRLKKNLRGRRFEDDDELTAAVEGWLGDQNVDFYRSGITDWQTRWNKCVELGGDYVEK
ncbi:histone-lysine N-methyltransferase SETMAR-like [Haliotis cracherodii]|uniref:histone-lysine N-methyltransferase SETMAR-like n=1 Tax=Haliotis cracherodii TaxID=6455 RepID=UPI0039EB1FAE